MAQMNVEENNRREGYGVDNYYHPFWSLFNDYFSESEATDVMKTDISENDDGYELEAITVKDVKSADVAVTLDTSDKSKYTFTMPESNVTVSATFADKPIPLTLEALTAGTIVVSSPKSGMQYSLNGGEKTAVTSEAITVAAGDTVSFYGNGTSITIYNGTNIAGGDAEVKVYGNIMSLVDETGFATATALAQNAFRALFYRNTKLKDASGLLL